SSEPPGRMAQPPWKSVEKSASAAPRSTGGYKTPPPPGTTSKTATDAGAPPPPPPPPGDAPGPPPPTPRPPPPRPPPRPRPRTPTDGTPGTITESNHLRDRENDHQGVRSVMANAAASSRTR